MRRGGRAAALLLAVLAALTLTGCAASGADQFYALPQLADEYVQLEALIAQRIRAGGEYAAPTAGSNRQTVQLHDLDGDGTAEAVAFLADGSHTPNVCVYRRDETGNFHLYAYVEGIGSAVSSVEYADLTGDGASELILAWQLSGNMRLLSAYDLGGAEPQQLLSAACSGFQVCDMDGDGTAELMDISEDYYGWTAARYVFAGGLSEETEAAMSDGVTSVLRMRVGALSDGSAALFVDSRWGEDELITDVFAVNDGKLRNITMRSSGRSGTVRAGEAFSADINGDRAIEIPESDGGRLMWFSVDPDGDRALVMTTWHDYEDGWYLRLTDELAEAAGERSSAVPGEAAVAFTAGGERLLTIYTLTGENRLDRAGEAGRFILAQDSSTVFAAEIPAGSPLTRQTVADDFSIIYQEWQSGVL